MARAFVLSGLVLLASCTDGSAPRRPAMGTGTTGATLTGYTSGIFCTTPDGVTHKVECGCAGAPCEDGNPSTLFDVCAGDMNSCLPGSTQPAEVCGNGVDDDCDLLTDLDDPECMTGCAPREDCNSPADDDCDGAANGDDWKCIVSWSGCFHGYVAVSCNEWCVAHCFDGWQDGDEGGVDCGGSCEARCASGASCWGGWGCASGECASGVCR